MKFLSSIFPKKTPFFMKKESALPLHVTPSLDSQISLYVAATALKHLAHLCGTNSPDAQRVHDLAEELGRGALSSMENKERTPHRLRGTLIASAIHDAISSQVFHSIENKDKAAIAPTINEVLDSKWASAWLKDAIRSALLRDPVDAANDCDLLNILVAKHTDHILAHPQKEESEC